TTALNLLGIQVMKRCMEVAYFQPPLSERIEGAGAPCVQVDPQPFGIASVRPGFERVKGDAEEARRLFVRQSVSGSLARACRVIDGLVDRVSRCHLREVISELGERRIRFI